MKTKIKFIFLISFILLGAMFATQFCSVSVSAEKFLVKEKYYFKQVRTQIQVYENKTLHIEQQMEFVDFFTNDPSEINLYLERYGKKEHVYNSQTVKNSYIYYLNNVSAQIDGQNTSVSISTEGYMDRGKYKLTIAPVKKKNTQRAESTQTLNLSYDYDISGDTINDFDDVNICLWDSQSGYVHDFQCTIDFPSSINAFEISYRIFADNTLSDRTHESGTSENRLTFQSTLENNEYRDYYINTATEKGYFNVKKKNVIDPSYILVIVFFLVSILLILIMLLKNKKRCSVQKQPVTIKKLNAMFKGLDFVDLAYIYRKKIKFKDFSCFVLKWAAERVVDIESDIGDTIKIIKRKELISNNELEKNIFDLIFASNEEYSSLRSAVHFDKKEYDALSMIKRKYQTQNASYFKKESGFSVYKLFPVIFGIASLLPLLGYIIYMCMVTQYFITFFLLIFIFAGFIMISFAIKLKTNILMFMGILFMLMPLAAIAFFMYMPQIDNFFLFPVSIVYLIVLQAFIAKFQYRNTKNIKVCKNIELFLHYFNDKTFIKTIISSGPEYFNTFLPYIYCFGGLKKLSKLIKKNSKQMVYPEWMKNFDLVSMEKACMSLFPYSKQLKKEEKENNKFQLI